MRILVATRDSVLVINPDLGSMERARLAADVRPTCIAADPSRLSRVWCGTRAGAVLRTDDGGATWVEASSFEGREVTALAASPVEAGRDGALVYAGTEPSAIFRSENGGDSWRECPGLEDLPSAESWSFPPRPETHHVRWIACDPIRTGRLWAAIEAGALIRSRDGGETWEDRVPGGPIDTHTLATHASAPGRLYSAAGDGYFESEDGGLTWTTPEVGLEERYLVSVAVDSGNPDTVLVSASRGPWQAYGDGDAHSRIYRRSEGGAWKEVTAGLPPAEGRTVAYLAADPYEAGVFYAAMNLGVVRSSDGGVSWVPVPLSWPEERFGERVHALVVVDGDRGGG
ncbi:MAG TPA: hypothetical protein VM737_05365 [Gemmatimonadota bacterium]|nr:hypothetical protein [Gemmatimonadota bacterium]